MGRVCAWARCVGAGSTPEWRELLRALRGREDLALSLDDGGAGSPGLLFVPADCEETRSELAAWQQQRPGPVIVIANRRADLGAGGHWEFETMALKIGDLL